MTYSTKTCAKAVLVAFTALFSACTPTSCTRPTINTVSVPEGSIAVRPVPVLRGKSNRAVGIYANECAAALDAREQDIENIRKAVAP